MGAYLMGRAIAMLYSFRIPEQLPMQWIGSALSRRNFRGDLCAALDAPRRLESLVVVSRSFFRILRLVAGAVPPPMGLLARAGVGVGAGAICPMMGWTLANYTLTTQGKRGGCLDSSAPGPGRVDLRRHDPSPETVSQLALLVISLISAASTRFWSANYFGPQGHVWMHCASLRRRGKGAQRALERVLT